MIAPLLLTLLSRFPGFERELRLLPTLLRPGRVAVDIGAALGVYAVPMAVLVGATGAVLAYEPRPEAAHRLRRLAGTLGFDHLQVHATALGARPGQQQLVIPRRRRAVPGRSFLHPGAGTMALDDRLRPGRVLDVPVSTLDDTRRSSDRPIDFIKCDVEGAEHDVFTGGHDVLTDDRPTVLCEIEDRHTRRYGGTVQRVLDLFARYDYRPVDLESLGCAPRNMLLVPRERSWPSIVAAPPRHAALAPTGG
ncbi:MAG: FkbM family methyltransferase [Acidimicrobiales bacterium]|nr:FkbM family methyltransferase [Acidimicrobiales bacterium]